MNEDLDELLTRPTISVPEAGRAVGNLGRNGSYEAARRGDIPVIQIGRRKRVPTSWLRDTLGLGQPSSTNFNSPRQTENVRPERLPDAVESRRRLRSVAEH